MKTILYCFTILAAITLLSGCEALSNYDRSLALVANVNANSGAIEYSIVPAAKAGEGRLIGKVRIEGSLSEGKQIIRLER